MSVYACVCVFASVLVLLNSSLHGLSEYIAGRSRNYRTSISQDASGPKLLPPFLICSSQSISLELELAKGTCSQCHSPRYSI